MTRRRFKTALALSGGSARALAHLGILQELQDSNIQIDMIVGTSMGAILGGLYASYGDAEIVIQKMRELLASELFLQTVAIASEDVPSALPDSFLHRFVWLFRRGIYYTHSMTRPTLVAEETYAQIMTDLIPDCDIEELKIPFAAVTVDILTGEEVVLTTGSLRKAVSASAALPGILPAVELNGRSLVDGGWVDNVPVAPAIALGAHFVIAADASWDLRDMGPLPTTAIENLFRCNQITRVTLDHHRRSFADVLLIPRLGTFYWADFQDMDRCLPAGRNVTKKNLDYIKRKRRHRKYRSIWGRIHPARSTDWLHPFVVL